MTYGQCNNNRDPLADAHTWTVGDVLQITSLPSTYHHKSEGTFLQKCSMVKSSTYYAKRIIYENLLSIV